MMAKSGSLVLRWTNFFHSSTLRRRSPGGGAPRRADPASMNCRLEFVLTALSALEDYFASSAVAR